MTTIKKATLLPLLLLALFGLAACATGSGGGGEGSGDPGEATFLTVDNQSTFIMNIYALRQGGSRRRLGQARSLGRTTFTIPATMVFGSAALRFQADPVGGNQEPITNEIRVEPGDTVVMIIPAGWR